MTPEDPRTSPQDSAQDSTPEGEPTPEGTPQLASEPRSEPADESTVQSEDEPTEPARKPKRKMSLWQESLLLLVIALTVAIVLKTFFVQAFYIPSESMEPGLVKGDRILVQKVSYWGSGTPERGDVVVFQDPGNWLPGGDEPTNALGKVLVKIGLQPSGGHLVKRVIGVAGDTVTCCDKQGRISINGHAMDESAYVKDNPTAPCNGPMQPNACRWKVGPIPEGQLFVMGDNRGNSADSTVHLCPRGDASCVDGDEYVPTDLVVGKVFVLAWPAKRFEWIGRPAEFDKVPDPTS